MVNELFFSFRFIVLVEETDEERRWVNIDINVHLTFLFLTNSSFDK